MKTINYLTICAALLCASSCSSRKTLTTPSIQAQQWYEEGAWRHGFTPQGFDEMDVVEFYNQYQKHPAMYDSIFTWLATVDGTKIPAGKSVKVWSHALANVQDLELRPTEKCRIEQHHDHIDLQWDLTGTERYGLVRDTTLLEAINKYKPDVQNFKCKTDFKRIDSRPDRFFLFFPKDYHQACEIANQPETVRKIVVKIEYFK